MRKRGKHNSVIKEAKTISTEHIDRRHNISGLTTNKLDLWFIFGVTKVRDINKRYASMYSADFDKLQAMSKTCHDGLKVESSAAITENGNVHSACGYDVKIILWKNFVNNVGFNRHERISTITRVERGFPMKCHKPARRKFILATEAIFRAWFQAD